jgi:8-oxo-dGTP pyrophosphatase MutT (NUDIX family)
LADTALSNPPDRHVAAAVLVAEDGRYLMQLRDERPGLHLSGHWGLFGGSLEPGETPEAALRREIREELAHEVSGLQPLLVSQHAIGPVRGVYRMHYFAVPFRLAELDRMVQSEGAGKALMTIAEIQRLERVAPWDLCALLIHARCAALFPESLDAAARPC